MCSSSCMAACLGRRVLLETHAQGRGLALAFQRSAVLSTHSLAWIYMWYLHNGSRATEQLTPSVTSKAAAHKFRWKQLAAERHSGSSEHCLSGWCCEDFALSLAQPAKSPMWTKQRFCSCWESWTKQMKEATEQTSLLLILINILQYNPQL